MRWRFKHYQPLDSDKQEIRLLKIGRKNHELHTFPLSSAPFFHAISYVWGPQHDLRALWIDGLPFFASRHLCALLDVLAEQEPGEFIWVDAICIDQGNIDERNAQVSFMHEIYKKAEDCYSWLGHNDEQMSFVFEILAEFEVYRADAKLERKESFMPDLKHRDYAAFMYELELTSQISSIDFEVLDFAFIDVFLAAEYWRRVWVVQEIVIPSTVHLLFRRYRAGLEDAHLLRTISRELWIRNHRRPIAEVRDGQTALYAIRNARRLWQSNAQGLKVLQYMESEPRSDRSKDPRDKIYGLRGLCPELQKVPVDYGKPMGDLSDDCLRLFVTESAFPYATLLSLHKYLSISSFDLIKAAEAEEETFHIKLNHCWRIVDTDLCGRTVPGIPNGSIYILRRHCGNTGFYHYSTHSLDIMTNVTAGNLFYISTGFDESLGPRSLDVAFLQVSSGKNGTLEVAWASWILQMHRPTYCSKEDAVGLKDYVVIAEAAEPFSLTIHLTRRMILSLVSDRKPIAVPYNLESRRDQ